VTHETGDVRQVIERIAGVAASRVACQMFDYAGRKQTIVAAIDEALKRASQPAPSGWQQRIAAIARDASERVAKNAGVAPQLCYAPILWALQDALPQGQNAVDALPPAPEVKDAIAAAVDAELRPLADALIDAGHKLAQQAPPSDTWDDLTMLPAPKGER
jgi:hypothetical protein